MTDQSTAKQWPTRRGFLRYMVGVGAAPLFVPADVLRGATAPSNKITLGVLGVGAQGRWDMQSFLKHDDVRVTAICDVNQRNIAEAQRLIKGVYGSPDVKVWSDFRQMNSDASIDAVLMALPVHWHSIPSQDAILQGKHIYHEKPMAMSFEEAKCVRDSVRKKGVVFQFGTQQRSSIYFRWACELALNGRLGTIEEIKVSVPGGREAPLLEETPVPDYVDWDRWVGPAPMTSFHEDKLKRNWHEHITNFSLGMLSCWGIHHLDIAQWGNGTDNTGPSAVEATGLFPRQGSCDAILNWKARFEFDHARPVTFVSDGQGIGHGVHFIGESGWVHVARNKIAAHDKQILRDPQNKCGEMPIKLPLSREHTRNFVDAIKSSSRAICDIETAVRSDTLCQIALIAVQEGRKLRWDPKAERFIDDDAANKRLGARRFRGTWKLS